MYYLIIENTKADPSVASSRTSRSFAVTLHHADLVSSSTDLSLVHSRHGRTDIISLFAVSPPLAPACCSPHAVARRPPSSAQAPSSRSPVSHDRSRRASSPQDSRESTPYAWGPSLTRAASKPVEYRSASPACRSRRTNDSTESTTSTPRNGVHPFFFPCCGRHRLLRSSADYSKRSTLPLLVNPLRRNPTELVDVMFY